MTVGLCVGVGVGVGVSVSCSIGSSTYADFPQPVLMSNNNVDKILIIFHFSFYNSFRPKKAATHTPFEGRA
jgi:hypothetical protein